MGRYTVPRIVLGRTVLMHGVSSRKGAVRTRLPLTNQMSKAACRDLEAPAETLQPAQATAQEQPRHAGVPARHGGE